jgi:hypothetical protein
MLYAGALFGHETRHLRIGLAALNENNRDIAGVDHTSPKVTGRCPRRRRVRPRWPSWPDFLPRSAWAHDNVPGMDVPGIDFCSIAKGYGVDAVAVTSAEAFAAALRQALLNRQPFLIEVTTPSE